MELETTPEITAKLLKKARAKYMSVRLALGLIELNADSILRKAYANTYYCANLFAFDEGKGHLKTKYCKNRWCLVCQRIRVANMIHGYEAQLSALDEPYFVTLTAPTVLERGLRARINKFQEIWRAIQMNVKGLKKTKTASFTEFKGIRKAECTLRPQGYYHFHYHVIINGKEQAEWLIDQWQKRVKTASMKAQDMRRADKRSMIEIFKYFTKLTAKDEGIFPTKDRYIAQFKRLDVVFRALRGKRVYAPFGGIKRISEEMEESLIPHLERPKGLFGEFWRWQEKTWVSEHGEILVDYEPSKTIENLMKYTPTTERKNEILRTIGTLSVAEK